MNEQDPRLKLVATPTRPVGVDVLRIAMKYPVLPYEPVRNYREPEKRKEVAPTGPPVPTISVYPAGKRHDPDGEVWIKSRWLTVKALHDAFPFSGPSNAEIAQIEALVAQQNALKARIDELIRRVGGAS